MILRLAYPPGQPQWSLHEIFKAIFAYMAAREHYALAPYHINRHLQRASEYSLHFNHQWILEAFLTASPQKVTNPHTNATATLHWYVPEELGDHIAHPHKLKLHVRIPMDLLLRAFPDLELTQRPNSSRDTLTEASMRAISESFVESYNGTVAQVEAVGPGDGYHFTFGTAGDQEAALRYGLVLPGDTPKRSPSTALMILTPVSPRSAPRAASTMHTGGHSAPTHIVAWNVEMWAILRPGTGCEPTAPTGKPTQRTRT